MTESGALMFARYAFPPNELGYCGPAGATAMLQPGAVDEIQRRARQFDGAWVYLELLAEALGTSDPLADEVVTAYWLGGPLLSAVPPDVLLTRLRERFVGQHGGTWADSAGRAVAHHSYQVFEVYPWAAMLRAGLPPGPAVSVLDRCRIRCGVVDAVDGEWATTTSALLVWDGTSLEPAAPSTERARWSIGGLSLMSPPVVGDVVALHWDWICDVLTPAQSALVEGLEAGRRAAVGLG